MKTGYSASIILQDCKPTAYFLDSPYRTFYCKLLVTFYQFNKKSFIGEPKIRSDFDHNSDFREKTMLCRNYCSHRRDRDLKLLRADMLFISCCLV